MACHAPIFFSGNKKDYTYMPKKGGFDVLNQVAYGIEVLS